MTNKHLHAVTGAFGYSGKYITQLLLDSGENIMSLTNSPNRANPFNDRVTAHLFHFDRPDLLVESLKGVTVLYNTYWVRFNHPLFTHTEAVRNTLTLFKTAKQAGVERVVHLSITNPSEDSPLEYFRGKAQIEKALINSGMSYAILRPTVLFGKEDILINNIAWTLRRLPVYGVFGRGNYRLQPMYVEDLAELAVTLGRKRENVIINAIGPETFTFRELVKAIGEIIGKPRPIISVPPLMGYLAGKFIGYAMKDILVTREEIAGLMSELLYVETKPTGKTRLTDWMITNADILGKHYANEMSRRRDKHHAYVADA